MWRTLFLFSIITVSVFSADITSTTNGSLSVFPVDPSMRGEDLVSMFDAMLDPNPPAADVDDLPDRSVLAQVSLLTTRTGLLSNVKAMKLTQNGTILLIRYAPNNVIPNLYAILPIEQIQMMIYSPAIIPVNGNFAVPALQGDLITFNVDPLTRAEDIQDAFNILNSTTLFDTSLEDENSNLVKLNLTSFKTARSKVGLQTNLSGPFYAPLVNGFIPDIQAIYLKFSSNGTLILVEYKPNIRNEFIIVTPDQVYGIVYSRS